MGRGRVGIKRWNDPRAPDDGWRLLVTRYRPRGMPKEREIEAALTSLS